MYLNVIQLAESFGVEESDIEGWVRNDGLPSVADRGRLIFDRAQVVSWAAARGLAAKAGFLAPERAASRSSGCLEPLLRAGGIWRNVRGAEVLSVLERVVHQLPGATPAVRELLGQRIRSRDGVTWAPVGGGFALPHLRTPVALGRNAGTLTLLLLSDALPLKEPPPDNLPVTRLWFFIAPSPRAHLEMLAQLSTVLTRGGLRQFVNDGAPDERIFAALATAESPAKFAP
jgi:PTS system nitrogen regulatory IIA component